MLMKSNRLIRFFSLACLIYLHGIADLLAAERVVMASLSAGLFEFPIQISTLRGFFKDEGLDVVKVQMQPQIAVMALVAGDVDYSLSWGSALRAAITGVPIRVVAGIAARPLHVLMARPKSHRRRISKINGSAWTPLREPWNTWRVSRQSIMGWIPIATLRC